MIRGKIIVGRGPVIELVIRGPDGSELDVDAVIDTGFTGALTLPNAIVAGLGLEFDSRTDLALGDGTLHTFDLHIAEVLWDGQWRTVLASALGDEVLVGMRMLSRHRMMIEAVPGGPVEIVALP